MLTEEERKERQLAGKKYRDANSERINANKRQWCKANVDRLREQRKQYEDANRKNINLTKREWINKNLEKHREYGRIRSITYAKELKDDYIKGLLCNGSCHLNFSNIPQELIELKRQQLIIHRALKERNQA